MSYYEDNLSKWYVSGNNKHSTFINQLKNEKLAEQVQSVIDMKKVDSSVDTRFDFDVPEVDDEGDETGTIHNEKFSVWYDEDPKRHKLYRLTPGENAEKGTPQKKGSSSGISSSSGTNDFKSKWYVESGTEDFVTLEEFKQRHEKDRMIIMLKPKDIQPTNYLIQKDGKEIPKVWIGKLKSNS